MVVEDRFGNNSKIKKKERKIVGSIENYDYYCMWLCTVVGGEKERVTEKSARSDREERKVVAVGTEDCVAHMTDSNNKQYFVRKFYSNNVFLWMDFMIDGVIVGEVCSK